MDSGGLPAYLGSTTDDDQAIVERFVESTREMIPTLQVSLAKRIIRPGSKGVLCLAARTSVPLNDEETASVSDLALRLSDGTNVVLSLSFFNDSSSVCSVPPAHFTYDPARYERRDGSRLGFVVLTTSVVALVGFATLLDKAAPSGLDLLTASTETALSWIPGARSPHLPASPEPASSKKTVPRSVSAKQNQTSRPNSSKGPARATAAPQRTRPPAVLRTTRKSSEVFVPPPPPYLPTLVAPEQGFGFANPFATVQPSRGAESRQQHPARTPAPGSPGASSPAPRKTEQELHATAQRSTPEIAPSFRDEGSSQEPQTDSRNLAREESSPSTFSLPYPPPDVVDLDAGNYSTFHQSAPLPGNSSTAHQSAPLPGNSSTAHQSAPLPGNYSTAHQSAPLPGE